MSDAQKLRRQEIAALVLVVLSLPLSLALGIAGALWRGVRRNWAMDTALVRRLWIGEAELYRRDTERMLDKFSMTQRRTPEATDGR